MISLLIRTPNGQHNQGIKRDCWVLNPRITQAKNPELMKCYQLIGGLMTRCGLDAEQQVSIAFAPTFWKLLLCDEPTLEEFALEDI